MSMTRQEVLKALADGREKDLRFEGEPLFDPSPYVYLAPKNFCESDWSLVKPVPIMHYRRGLNVAACGKLAASFAIGENWVLSWSDSENPITCPACLALKPNPPEMVPFGPEDVPPGSVFAWEEWLPHGVCPFYVSQPLH